MKKEKNILILALTVLCFILGGISVYIHTTKDKVSPEIFFDQTPISFFEGTDQSVLLSGVTASDNVDGDITDRVVIKRIVTDKNGFATVTYAVMDSSHNVTEKKRQIQYIAEKSTTTKATTTTTKANNTKTTATKANTKK